MGKKNNNNKIKINCPICNKQIIKKYISQHIRSQHPNDNYCKFVCKGTTYKVFNNNNTNINFIKDDQFYCQLCHKTMNIYSKYKHFKTKMHISLSQAKNKIDYGSIENNNNTIQIYEKTKEVFDTNNKKISYKNKNNLISNIFSSTSSNKNKNNNKGWSNDILKIDDGIIQYIIIGKKSETISESSKSEESPSFKDSSSSKSKNIFSSSDSDSSSSFSPENSKRKNDFLWGPDADRIEKEVNDVIKRINEENKRKRKNNKI
jgi:hypothetical protein